MKLIEEGQNNNEIKPELDPKQIATIIMGSMRLTVLKWKFNNFKTDLELDGSELWITIEKLIKQLKKKEKKLFITIDSFLSSWRIFCVYVCMYILV